VEIIEKGKTALGIEFGSTRIKAVLVDEKCTPIAGGSFEWENQLENGIWTYSVDMIWEGLRKCYSNLADNVRDKYGLILKNIGSIGLSGMMHGYMPFDKAGNILTPFRTWRNSITGKASEILTKEFDFNIPQRWSIAHLYQAILNNEKHIGEIDFFTTLSGYIHWKLTGKKIVGIGEASGMFPIDSHTKSYNSIMIDKFNKLIEEYNFKWKIEDILPMIMVAGERAGELTEEGARLLDPSGELNSGIAFCPPEGDAGTGMTATNSIALRTGNVSAGTSVFSMVVLEKELKRVYPEIDIVTTPVGDMVGMVHCNNCTSDINAWIRLFGEFAECFEINIEKEKLFSVLFEKAMKGNKSCEGLMAYNYFSGENITGLDEGRPLFVRSPKADFSLADFMRTLIYSSLSTLKIGMDIMTKQEGVIIDELYGHGGFFKTKGVGQLLMAAALNTPVSVMADTAGEGGAWGISILAAYMLTNKNQSLEEFLDTVVFREQKGYNVTPDKEDVEGFDKFIKEYKAGLGIEKEAVKSIFRD